MVLEPEDRYIDAALEIALKYGLTVYDSLYIALALKNKKPLLTLDTKQKRCCKKTWSRGDRAIESQSLSTPQNSHLYNK